MSGNTVYKLIRFTCLYTVVVTSFNGMDTVDLMECITCSWVDICSCWDLKQKQILYTNNRLGILKNKNKVETLRTIDKAYAKQTLTNYGHSSCLYNN